MKMLRFSSDLRVQGQTRLWLPRQQGTPAKCVIIQSFSDLNSSRTSAQSEPHNRANNTLLPSAAGDQYARH
jgi:hypothetical protein